MRIFGSIIGLLLLIGGWGSWFTVDPTQMANVRRFGNVVYDKPIGPGLHFKLPLVDTVDKIQVSRTTLHVDPFKVNTVDNQIIELGVNVTFDIPADSAQYLMYHVGQAGSFDLHQSIVPIIKDRISRVIASKNTVTFSAQREEIQAETEKFVRTALLDMYKLSLDSIQFDTIGYSEAFIASNNNAVLAKNKAVQEENNLKVIQYQAQQRVISAQGLASEAVAAAEGRAKATISQAEAENKATILHAQAENQATILKAQAEAQGLKLRGEGESLRLKAEADALGGPSNYVSYQEAMAKRNWTGAVPTNVTQVGGNAAGNVPLILTLPTGAGTKQ